MLWLSGLPTAFVMAGRSSNSAVAKTMATALTCTMGCRLATARIVSHAANESKAAAMRRMGTLMTDAAWRPKSATADPSITRMSSTDWATKSVRTKRSALPEANVSLRCVRMQATSRAQGASEGSR